MSSKIRKLEDFLLSAKSQGMLTGGSDRLGRNCTDICTVGTDPIPPTKPKPKPDEPEGCGWCNCRACWGEEAQWFAAGLQWATNLNG